MRHHHDDHWKQNKPDCNHNGIMSYYKPEEDQEKIRLLKEKRWDGVWTSCNIEDLYKWWNDFGKDCSFVNSKNILPGTIRVLTIPTYFFKVVNCKESESRPVIPGDARGVPLHTT